MHGNPTLQVGQSESVYPVPPAGSAEQRVQSAALAAGHELTTARGPPQWRAVPGEHGDLADIRLGHRASLSNRCKLPAAINCETGKYPSGRCTMKSSDRAGCLDGA